MTDVIKEKIFKGRKRSTLAFLLSLIAIGASAYLYYLANHIVKNAQEHFAMIEETSSNNIAQLNSQINILDQNILVLDRQVSSLSASSIGVVNHELNELISLGNQSLIIYNDIPATIKLLKYAESLLANNNNAIYTQLKVSLTNDLDTLGHLTIVDPTITATKLNNIIADVDSLQLLVTNSDNGIVTPIDDSQTELPKWKIFLENVKITLLGLVQVSKVSKNDALRLLPQQEVIIRQNVKLDILNARMALLLHDETNWLYSLNDAKSSISNYFIVDGQSTNLVNEINELSKQNISTVGVNIDKTLTALNQLNNINR